MKSSLAAHSLLGLAGAVLLYVLCVSGTVAVVYPQLERWEQAGAVTATGATPDAVQRAVESMLAAAPTPPDHLVVNLPTPDAPWLVVHGEAGGRFADAQGALHGREHHPFTRFLAELHYALSLPTAVGLPVVGVLGVMMAALVITGLLAHPSMIRDAFHLRLGRSERLAQVDLHNRLGVWAAPFHLVIALTGAFIGLLGTVMLVIALVFADGDREAVAAPLYGADPVPTGVAAPVPDVAAALRAVPEVAPGLQPFYVVVHEPMTTAQVVDVGSHAPRRLVWANMLRFDGEGGYLGSNGWADGAVGAQLYASTFRLHFGHFGGLPVQLVWILLGFTACAVAASGTRIWLLRRRQRGWPAPRLERAWTAVVWGTPALLGANAVLTQVAVVPTVAVFWAGLAALTVAAAMAGNVVAWSRGLRALTAVVLGGVVTLHLARFGSAALAPPALTVNLLWIVATTAFAISCLRRRSDTAVVSRSAFDAAQTG